MFKCSGCGVKLQNSDKNSIGYVNDINNKLCERCFRIRNYNEYKYVSKTNDDFIEILKGVNKSNDLVVLVVDLFNISKDILEIGNYIKNNVLLVLTKRDILPLSCYDEKIKRYFDGCTLNILDTVIVSSKKNYNLDELYNKIFKYKSSNRVYFVGYTNSGKSTLINKIIYNYSDSNNLITTSNIPSTTIDSIEVKINSDLVLIDTPGLLDKCDIINYLTPDEIKKVIPSTEIKPITYQVKGSQSIFIDNFAEIDVRDCNITIYASNNLNISRVYNTSNKFLEYKKNSLCINNECDIVIQGLCFINIKNSTEITIYTKDSVNVFTRKNLI